MEGNQLSCPKPQFTELELNLCVRYSLQQYYQWTVVTTPSQDQQFTAPTNEPGVTTYSLVPPIVHTISSDRVLRNRLQIEGSVKVANVGEHRAANLQVKAFLLAKEGKCGCSSSSPQPTFSRNGCSCGDEEECKWRVVATQKLTNISSNLRAGCSQNIPIEWTVPLATEESVFRLLVVAKLTDKHSCEKRLFEATRNIIPQNRVLVNEQITVVDLLRVTARSGPVVDITFFNLNGDQIAVDPVSNEIEGVTTLSVNDPPLVLTGVTSIVYEIGNPAADQQARFSETYSVTLLGDDGSNQFSSRSETVVFA